LKTEQAKWTEEKGWFPKSPGELGASAQLVLAFGSRAILEMSDHLGLIKKTYPKAHILGCSTAGEIFDTQVLDDSFVVTAVCFEHSRIEGAKAHIKDAKESFETGKGLARALSSPGLVHVFVISDGLEVNGSELARGLTEALPAYVSVTGGLSSDGEQFKKTLVLWDDQPASHSVVVLGLYGERLKIGFGSLGGWDTFGPDRMITRSKGNVLYELDGKSALDLYKTYLGEHAAGLPATGLLFPLSLMKKDGSSGVVRTILAVNEADKSMTFAGDVPEGAYARLMKANFDRLINGAHGAAETSYATIGSTKADLAILISCVGRKLILKQRVEEEVEAVRDVLGETTCLAGFYSYGEIAPFIPSAKCELHNQTMTITTIAES